MKIGLLSILFCGFFATSFSQDVQVHTWFDTTRIYLGDHVGFNVLVEQNKVENLTIQSFSDTLTGKIEILAGPLSDTAETSDGRLRILNKYLVTCFDSGYYQIPPVYAEKRTSDGIQRFYSDYAPLEVIRVRITPSDTTSRIFDIIDPYKAPVTIEEVLPWILITAIAAGLAILAFRIIRKLRQKKSGAPVPVITEPAHVIAFRDLETLRNENLWQKGDLKEYYSRLTDILRKYLENRFGVSSPEMTTGETMDALLKSGFTRDKRYELLKEILSGADLVKFAKFIPGPSENESSFNSSWDFVDLTKADQGTDPQADITKNEKKSEL